MQLHNLKNEFGASKSRKRVGRGRGSGMGKTSGRGHKGQYARKGHKHKDHFEGGQMPLLRRIPKRGFKNPTRKVYEPVNVAELNVFEDGSVVDIETMATKGLVSSRGALVKILGTGTLERNLTVQATACSASAREKITARGGTCITAP